VINSLGGGTGTGTLENFALLVNGERITASDRNIWGVSFLPGQADLFYATAASSGRIWLVKGSTSSRTLTAVHDGVECPSVSPDGTRVAFKKNAAGQLSPHWQLAILDLSTGKETVLAETRNVDDQPEWLDGQTILYGLSRTGDAGDSDVWQIKVDSGSRPSVFIENAWSPSVVR
jgi:Tol biopolymer transport system component